MSNQQSPDPRSLPVGESLLVSSTLVETYGTPPGIPFDIPSSIPIVSKKSQGTGTCWLRGQQVESKTRPCMNCQKPIPKALLAKTAICKFGERCSKRAICDYAHTKTEKVGRPLLCGKC